EIHPSPFQTHEAEDPHLYNLGPNTWCQGPIDSPPTPRNRGQSNQNHHPGVQQGPWVQSSFYRPDLWNKKSVDRVYHDPALLPGAPLRIYLLWAILGHHSTWPRNGRQKTPGNCV